jgi:iron complex transport system permease protein
MIAPANTPLEASSAPASGSSLNRHRAVVRVLLAAILTAVVLTGLSLGAVPLPSGVVLGLLAQALELPIPAEPTEAQAAVLLHIRLPRVILGMLVGGGLAVAGAAMQALFRNPLADPAIIGVSSGAALVAVAVIVLGDTVLQGLHGLLGIWTLPVAAFLGGLGVTALVYRLSWEQGETHMASLLLGGIAINSLAGAATGLLIYMADDAQLRTLTFWAMGSLGGASWVTVLAALPGVQAACLVIVYHAQALNALLLGEAEARHLGIDVERVKRALIAASALAVGTAVAVAGVIGFVGLVVPHLARLLLGPDHRYCLLACALIGSALLTGADLAARTLVAPAELPIGILTALLGAPFFLWLLLRKRNGGAAC